MGHGDLATRRRTRVALCVAVGAAIAVTTRPGVLADDGTFLPALAAPSVPPGFTIDRQIRDNSGPIPSIFTYAHRGSREIKPGERGYVPEPKPGEPGYEPSG
jgi:hypothetical protein